MDDEVREKVNAYIKGAMAIMPEYFVRPFPAAVPRGKILAFLEEHETLDQKSFCEAFREWLRPWAIVDRPLPEFANQEDDLRLAQLRDLFQ